MKHLKTFTLAISLLITSVLPDLAQEYSKFNVAVYCRAYEVEKMGDPEWLRSSWDLISRQVHVDKIYLETHRDLLIVDEETIKSAIRFFREKGVKVGGGITYTIDESNSFETFCYSNPEHREKVKQIAEYTAGFFDEFILDDFFFTSCKCDLCIAAKKELSWTEYRLALMKEAAKELVIEPARAVNPGVEVVIKYPNWYEHFQGLGFNLEDEPALFDGLYTGTETRDRSGNQHLQQYHGYAVFRYFENLKPGNNRGGWVDTGGSNPLDRYAEQLWLTLFAKAPEITLFDIRQMLIPLRMENRPAWQGSGTSFDLESMTTWLEDDKGLLPLPVTYAGAAGYALHVVDGVLAGLGDPVGVKCYKPYHSVGEDFLQNYLGMIGIPIDIVPEFPEDEPMVLLTETASFDPSIVDKMKEALYRGHQVTITSGLYKALQGKGIEDIVELRVTDRKASVKEFRAGWGPPVKVEKEMLIPQINYLTNDSWEVVSALDDTNGWPILHRADYSKGRLLVLTVPDNFIDLYNLPAPVLNVLRQNIAGHLDVMLEGPGEIALIAYNNHSFVVESFLDEPVDFQVILSPGVEKIRDLATGEEMIGAFREAPSFRNRKFGKDATVFNLQLKPHSFKAFQYKSPS
jgi:hypothetical protein